MIHPWDSEAAKKYGRVRAALEQSGGLLGNLDTMIAAQVARLRARLGIAGRARGEEPLEDGAETGSPGLFVVAGAGGFQVVEGRRFAPTFFLERIAQKA